MWPVNMGILIQRKAITCDEFNVLCRSVGWSEARAEHFDTAISHSFACVYASIDGQIAGFCRLVGDVGLYLYVQDLVVHQLYQKRGIGTALIKELHMLVDEIPMSRHRITLVADQSLLGFYERIGYTDTGIRNRVMIRAT